VKSSDQRIRGMTSFPVAARGPSVASGAVDDGVASV
jgi:hypothetical protein